MGNKTWVSRVWWIRLISCVFRVLFLGVKVVRCKCWVVGLLGCWAFWRVEDLLVWGDGFGWRCRFMRIIRRALCSSALKTKRGG